MKCVRAEPSLLSDLFYALVGLDCNLIRVRKSATIDVFFKSSISQDDIQIINTLLSIIVGIKECRYKIDEEYFSSEVIKQYLFKGLEEEIKIFIGKVDQIRNNVKNIDVQALTFLFQEDIDKFSRISMILREIESVTGLFLLEVVMKSKVECSSIVSHLALPINRVLVRLVEGKETDGYFEERNTYDYGECFWSSHYRVKDMPSYLANSIGVLTDLGKISKIRKTVGEAQIDYRGDIIYIENKMVVINEQRIREYYSIIADCPIVREEWKSGITEMFGRIGLDVRKYSELFREMGSRILKQPSKKDISMVNYIMRRGSPGYSAFEEHVDSPSLSFLDDSTFLLESVEGVRTSPVSFIYSESSLSRTLLGIYDTKCSKTVGGLSLLQGLDISLSLREPLSMFFSAKSISEIKILFRLIYSLYAVEYFLCCQYSHWRIRQMLLGFVTGVRMFITEKIDEEFQKVINENNISMYHSTLENALWNITKASLLTSPFLIQFYSRVFSIAFMYIEIKNREMLTAAEVEEIIQSLKSCFKAAIPYVKSPFLVLLFESLV